MQPSKVITRSVMTTLRSPSFEHAVEFFAQSAQNAQLGSVDGSGSHTEFAGHFGSGPTDDDVLPERFPRGRLKVGLQDLQRLPGDVLAIFGVPERLEVVGP